MSCPVVLTCGNLGPTGAKFNLFSVTYKVHVHRDLAGLSSLPFHHKPVPQAER